MSCRIHAMSKSTSEQLRSDHIELLESLHCLKTDNENLKIEMKLLKEQLKSGSAGPSNDQQLASSDRQEVDVAALLDKNNEYESEIKLLKLRLSQRDFELLKQKQLSNHSHADLNKQYAANLEKMRKQCQDEYDSAAHHLETELSTARLELLEMQRIQDEHEQLRMELAAAQAELRQRTDELKHLVGRNEVLDREVGLLRTSNSDCNQLLNRKILDYNALKQTDNLMISSKNQEILNMTGKLQQQSNENQELKSIIRGRNEAIATLQQGLSTLNEAYTRSQQTIDEMKKVIVEKDQLIVMHSHSKCDDGQTFQFTSPPQPAEEPSSVRFEQYMLLKKENKELKLRLAEVCLDPCPQQKAVAALGNNISNNKTANTSKLPSKLRKSILNRR